MGTGISRPLLWDRYRVQLETTRQEIEALGEHHCDLRIKLMAAASICKSLDRAQLCAIIRINPNNIPEFLEEHLIGMAADRLVEEVDALDQGRAKVQDLVPATIA